MHWHLASVLPSPLVQPATHCDSRLRGREREREREGGREREGEKNSIQIAHMGSGYYYYSSARNERAKQIIYSLVGSAHMDICNSKQLKYFRASSIYTLTRTQTGHVLVPQGEGLDGWMDGHTEWLRELAVEQFRVSTIKAFRVQV